MADKKTDWNATFSALKKAAEPTQPKSDIGGQLATGALYDFPTSVGGMAGDYGRARKELLDKIGLPSNFYYPILDPFPAAGFEKLPSTEDVRSVASEVTGFTPRPYEELDTGEKYARTLGSFIPNVLTSPQRSVASNAPKAVRGAVNIAQRLASAVIPGAMSEAGGQAFEGEGLEPLARIIGAVAGGRVAGGIPSPQRAIKGAEVPLPKLIEDTNAAYAKLRGAGIAYDRNAFIKTLDDAAAEIKGGGIDSESIGRTITNLKAIGPNELDWTRLDTIRQNLNKVAYGANTSESDQLAAKLVLKRLNALETSPNFYMKPGATPVSPEYLDMQTKQARELAARRIKTRQIDSIIELAPTYAGTVENNLRAGFRRLLRDIKRNESVGWSKEEIAAIEDVAEGRKIVQALSKLSPSLRESLPGMTTAGSALLGAGTAGVLLGGPVGALAALLPPTIGFPSRYASQARTVEAARRAANIVSAPKFAREEAIAATEAARRGIRQRRALAVPSLVPGLLNEDRR